MITFSHNVLSRSLQYCIILVTDVA